MPAKKPTISVASTARTRFGTSAMTTSDEPGADDRRAERRGVARQLAEQPRARADPAGDAEEDRAEQQAVGGVAAAEHRPANSWPCAMIAPPAANAPSIPTSRPRTSGVCRANAQPSRRLATHGRRRRAGHAGRLAPGSGISQAGRPSARRTGTSPR